MSDEAERSLRGISVVITRSREQNAVLQEILEARGADVVSMPTLCFVAAPCGEAVREALLAHEDYTHLVFTSQTAVEFFAKACAEAGAPPHAWDHVEIAAVGAATASALEERGWSASVITSGTGDVLARELLASGHVDTRSHVLIAQSAIARPELEQALTAAGARVTSLSIYDTATETAACAEPFLARMRKGAPPEAILFASPSALKAFLELTGEAGEELLARSGTCIVSIGPTTSAAIRAQGYEVSAEAERPGIEGLVTALERAVRKRPPAE